MHRCDAIEQQIAIPHLKFVSFLHSANSYHFLFPSLVCLVASMLFGVVVPVLDNTSALFGVSTSSLFLFLHFFCFNLRLVLSEGFEPHKLLIFEWGESRVVWKGVIMKVD